MRLVDKNEERVMDRDIGCGALSTLSGGRAALHST